MNMYGKVFLVIVAVCLLPEVLTKTKRYTKSQANTLHKIRCDLMCIDRSKETKHLVSICYDIIILAFYCRCIFSVRLDA